MLYLGIPICFILTYHVTKVFYHIYLSPLRHIPSPWIFQWLPWYYQYLSARGDAPFVIYENHLKWGPVFRVGWRTVLFVDGEGASRLYKTYECDKTELYDSFRYAGESVFSTRSREIHKQRKRMVAPAYTKSNLKLMERFIIDTGTLPMISKLNKFIDDKVPVIDLYHEFHYMSWDIMGEVGLGCSFNMLKNGAHPIVGWLSDTLRFCALCNMFPIMMKFPCQSLINVREFVGKALNDYYNQKQTREKQASPSTPRILDFYIENGNKVYGDRLDREAIFAEVNLMLLGGTDTISTALSWFFYYLAKHQDIQDSVYQEIRLALATEPLVDGIISYTTCQNHLVYLEAAMKETMRLMPPTSIAFLRYIPKGGLNIMGYDLPEGTQCAIPIYAVQRSPNLWENSDEFLPSRWLTKDYQIGSLSQNTSLSPEMIKLQSPHFMPFMFGPRFCLGKDLSMMEMLIIAANLLHQFQFHLPNSQLPLPTLIACPITRPRDAKLDFIVTRRPLNPTL